MSTSKNNPEITEDMRYKTGKCVTPGMIVWQDARAALSAAGWLPLLVLHHGEHWARHGQRCILHIDSTTEDANEALPDETFLSGVRYVDFCNIDGILVATR